MFRAETQIDLVRVDDGTSGTSPTASITQTSSGATITITDTSGTTTANITNGQDGADGADGTSAYDAAVEGGYSGTEEDFNSDLADVPNKANQEDVDKIIDVGGKNLLQDTDWSEGYTDAFTRVRKFNGLSLACWSVWDDEDEDTMESGTYTIPNSPCPLLLEISFCYYHPIDEGQQIGDKRPNNGGIFQDVILEPNTNYTFSVYTYNDEETGVFCDCKALNSSVEVISNTGWNNAHTGWSEIIVSPYLKRLYKTFNTGNYTRYRFRIYGQNEWTGWAWQCDVEDESICNRIQLEKGTTPTAWESGYNPITVIQSQLATSNVEQNNLIAHINTVDTKLTLINNNLFDTDNNANILRDTEWGRNVSVLTKNPTLGSRKQWSLDNTQANEGWYDMVEDSWSTTVYDFNLDLSQKITFVCPFYRYSNSQTTYNDGDTVILNGGIYQDVQLARNTDYTFSVLYHTGTNKKGAFIDCKALNWDSSTDVYSTVSNTGFNIQEWDYYSGAKTWNDEEPYPNYPWIKRLYISFNTGSYYYYRFRVYGAVRWDAARSYFQTYGSTTRFLLKEGTDKNWDCDSDYSLYTIANRTEIPWLIDLLYPIGACYETTDTNFNPNSTWGGTWTKLGTQSIAGTSFTVWKRTA